MRPENLYTGDTAEYPASDLLPEGVKTLDLKDGFGYDVDFRPNVVYAHKDGHDLHLQLLLPEDGAHGRASQKSFPAVVFVQGSGWGKQQIYQHLPLMMRICEKGWVVAIVEYRHSGIASFPAQVEDCKTAIRFLRASAAEYRVLPDEIALWGDSSGGHTAVMAAITGDDELVDSSDDMSVLCKVNCVVDWYAPVDIARMNDYPSIQDHMAADSPEGKLIGGKSVPENLALAEKTNPIHYLRRDKALPPMLMMHGARDYIVHFSQSCYLYEALKEMGKQVEMYKLMDAIHGRRGFLCQEALDIVLEFMGRYCKA